MKLEGQTIYAKISEAVMTLKCFECDDVIECCDSCSKPFQSGGTIICFKESSNHFCSKECMKSYKRKNYSKEDKVELEE